MQPNDCLTVITTQITTCTSPLAGDNLYLRHDRHWRLAGWGQRVVQGKRCTARKTPQSTSTIVPRYTNIAHRSQGRLGSQGYTGIYYRSSSIFSIKRSIQFDQVSKYQLNYCCNSSAYTLLNIIKGIPVRNVTSGLPYMLHFMRSVCQ